MDMPTQDMLNDMYTLLQSGMDFNTMLDAIGMKPRKMKDWIARGHQDPDSIFGEMVRQIKQAAAMCDLRDLKTIDAAAANGEWKAAAWRLEHRRPHIWGSLKAGEIARPDSVTQALEEPNSTQTNLSNLSIEELKTLRALSEANLRQISGNVYEVAVDTSEAPKS